MFGIAKNRNVIVIHLESLQQDVINMKVNGEEVTPFLNSLYNNNPSVYSFSNFFNQVGQGKTSDAETMLETSTFGLSSGSLFSSLGSTQTFQAMPAILQQKKAIQVRFSMGMLAHFTVVITFIVIWVIKTSLTNLSMISRQRTLLLGALKINISLTTQFHILSSYSNLLCEIFDGYKSYALYRS